MVMNLLKTQNQLVIGDALPEGTGLLPEWVDIEAEMNCTVASDAEGYSTPLPPNDITIDENGFKTWTAYNEKGELVHYGEI